MDGGLKQRYHGLCHNKGGDVRCRNEHTLVCFPVFSRRP
nr:MAG TPA_asm: hypothetical protein [Caudoviricetes sp.]